MVCGFVSIRIIDLDANKNNKFRNLYRKTENKH